MTRARVEAHVREGLAAIPAIREALLAGTLEVY